MGWKANLAEVFTWTGYPKSNGVVWNVREEYLINDFLHKNT
jgi:hypothetical protein